MGKGCKSLGVNKAATAGGGNGKRPAGAYYKSLGVNKAATAGGGNGKRSGGGAKGAGGAGGRGWGGASTFSPTGHSTIKTAEMVTKTTMRRRTEVRMRFSPSDHSTDVSVTNEYHEEKETRCSIEDVTFSPTDHGTIGMAVGVMNGYYDEEECGLSGDEKDVQDDAELLPYEYNNGAEMGDYVDYNKNAWVGDDGAEDETGDDILNGDYYNYDVVGGFDEGYDNDGGDGADGWW